MTAKVYVHDPKPPYPRLHGPILPRVGSLSVVTGLSIDTKADLSLTASDVEYAWLRTGMCWVIDQSDIGEPPWAGFVAPEQIPMDAGVVPLSLIGPKEALLSVEMAVHLPLQETRGAAIRSAIELVQAQLPMNLFPGDMEQVGAPVNIDVRGELVSNFIESMRDATCGCDWRERTVVKADSTVEFLLDFGMLQHHTSLVLTRDEIITASFTRKRAPVSLTQIGAAPGFAERDSATVAHTLGRVATRGGSPNLVEAKPEVMAHMHDRDIGPAAMVHVTEISERITTDLSVLAQERQMELLHSVDEFPMALDATKEQVQQLQLGDVVLIDVKDWFPGLDVMARVHVRRVEPDSEAGQKDILAAVVVGNAH